MYFQFLIEDMSGEILTRHVMDKLSKEHAGIYFDCKAFKGIGGLKVSSNIQEIKTNKLLNDLKHYLRGFDKALKDIPAAIFIVLDNDKRDTDIFMQQLIHQADIATIQMDYVFCIAVEEMEAWLLGDKEAILQAYPNAREMVLKDYKQDSICGTWEFLANALYKGGLKNFQKDCPTYREVGKYKAKWADEIGRYMVLDRNISPSFQHFILELHKRV